VRIAVANWTNRRAGGAETYLALLVPALERLGHELFFWHEVSTPDTRNPIAGVRDAAACSVSTVGLQASIRAVETWRPDVLFVQHVDEPGSERALLDVAPGVFFAHDYYGTCISGAKTFKFPVVTPCAREFGPSCLVNYFPRRCGGLSPLTMAREYRRQALRLRMLRRYEAIVTFSEHMRREYVKHGFAPERVAKLPPVDPMWDRPALDRGSAPIAILPVTTRTHRITFIGRMDPLKGCGTLLDALPMLRAALDGRILVTVAGDGADMDHCRVRAREMTERLDSIEVIFLGWVPPDRCSALLDASDVLAMPSLWPEPFGLAGIEAQRRGVPVAAFASGGIPEWLDDGRGGALAPADPPTADGLSAAIVRCLTSPDIRASIRERAHERATRFSIDEHVDELLPVLGKAAGSAPHVATSSTVPATTLTL
jgi:glycosyltransferase involved in cell wall biosynthesis